MKVPPFKDHANCQGHANFMLDCDYSDPKDRELMRNVLDARIESIGKEIKLEELNK